MSKIPGLHSTFRFLLYNFKGENNGLKEQSIVYRINMRIS
jgi:hypothetical protein